MENTTLNFYHYAHFIEAILYLYKQLGGFLVLFLIPIFIFYFMYIYRWWKLLLLQVSSSLTFYLLFNQVEWTALNVSVYSTILSIIYAYTYISIIFMMISALTYERYELVYNLQLTWKFIVKFFTLLVKFAKFINKTFKSSQIPIQNTIQGQSPQASVPVAQITQAVPKKLKSVQKTSTNNLLSVYTETGYKYTLKKELDFGGEAHIHVISNLLLAKIFLDKLATQEKIEKITQLSIYSIDSVILPKKLLFNKDKKFIGYTMEFIHETIELGKLHSPKNRKKYFPNWTYIDLLDLSITTATVIKNLHDKNIIVSDFNPRNVLVKESMQVYFIDTDSFQINRKPSTVGIDLYTRPINLNKSQKSYLKNKADDTYALSVIIFQNLMSGSNPYVMKGEGDEAQLIKRHQFAFDVNNPNKCNVKNELINEWFKLSKDLREYFQQVFGQQKPLLISALIKHLVAHKRCLMLAQTKARRIK